MYIAAPIIISLLLISLVYNIKLYREKKVLIHACKIALAALQQVARKQ